MRQSVNFADSLTRLGGLHGLRPPELARVLGVTAQAFSKWRRGGEPGAATLVRLREVFEVDGIAMMTQPFIDVLPSVCDPGRFERVEERLLRERRNLRAG